MNKEKIRAFFMNKTVISVAVAVAVAVGCFGGAIGLGATSVNTDPLVSLSYINEVVIPAIQNYVDEKLAANTDGNAGSVGNDTFFVENGYAGEVPVAPVSSEYTILRLSAGSTLYASEAALEVIIRSGSAAVVSPYPDQGIADITYGVDLLNGTLLSPNHYCIIPRDDGRGITVVSDVVYVMVRGTYEVR